MSNRPLILSRWLTTLSLLALLSCQDNQVVEPQVIPIGSNAPHVTSTAEGFSFTIDAFQFSRTFSDTLDLGTDSLLASLVVSDFKGGRGLIEVSDAAGFAIMRDSITGNQSLARTLVDKSIARLFRVTLNGLSAKVVFTLARSSAPQNLWQRVWKVGRWIETILAVKNGEVFVGTYDSALFHSTDNGTSFTPTPGAWLPLEDVYSLAKAVDGYLYLGTFGGAFYRSSDHGATWSMPSYAYATYYDLYPAAAGEVFAAVLDRGVRRTTDHGSTWTEYAPPDRYAMAVVQTRSGSWLVGTNSGLYVSPDSARTWTHNTSGVPSSWVYTFEIASNGNIFAGCDRGVYRSTDDGINWRKTNFQPDTAGVFSLATSPNDYLIAGVTGQGVFISSDYGTTWTHDVSGLNDKEVRCVAITPEGYVFAGTYKSGIYRTTKTIY